MSQALATQAPAKSGIITTQGEFRGSVQRWKEHRYHVLTPAADFAALPPQWGLLPVKVAIDIDEQAGEVYRDPLFCKGDEVCLTKIGLVKIAQAAGMSIKTERMDNRMIPNYWEVRATVRVVGLDGAPQEWTATEELDLRDGTERSKKVLGQKNATGALIAARAKGMRGCEARAINAAIRLYGIKQKYSAEDLKDPFIVVRMLFQPDMSNPTQAAIATSQALGGVSALYQSSPLASLPPAGGPEVIDMIPGHTGTQGAPADEPVAERPKGLMVETVTHDMETGLYAIQFAGGLLAVTEQGDVAKAAQQAKKDARPVTVDTELRDGVTFVTELQSAKAPASGHRPAAPGKPADTETLPDGTTTIVSVERKPGRNQKTGAPWMRYDVTFATGEIASTFSQTLHQLVDEAERQKARVRITTSEKEGYNDSLDKLEVIDKRQQSLPVSGEERY